MSTFGDRPGFTLVEMLVSMALMMFIMVILVEAFGAGMDTFQGMRAIGDVQEQLRGAAQVIEKDLSQDHFEGGRRCSDPNFWDEARREGFFAVRQSSKVQSGGATNAGYYEEGIDLDGVTKSYRARDHVLHFAVRLRGNERDKFFYDSTSSFTNQQITAVNADRDSSYGYRRDPSTLADSPILTSQWGEIGYCLLQHGGAQPTSIPETVTAPPAGGAVPLHNLYRYQYLVVPYSDKVSNSINYVAGAGPGSFACTSQKNAGGKFDFFSPNDLARGRRAFDPTAPSQSSLNKSLVCSNVVSFQVRVLKSTSGASGVYEDLVDAAGNPEPFDSMNKPANSYRLQGVQVILRIWEPSSGLTRQITVVQDL